MAGGADVPNDMCSHHDFLDASMGSAWDEESICFSVCGDHVPPVYYASHPMGDHSTEPFELKEPAPNFRYDNEDQIHPLQQPIQTLFSTNTTPCLTQETQQQVFKQEYIPGPTSPKYARGHAAQNNIIAPQYSPPSGSLSAAHIHVPMPIVTPPSPTSPVRSKRPLSSVSSSPSTIDGGAGGARSSRPKKRMTKPQVNSKKTPITDHQQMLHRLISADGTGVYCQHLPSAEIAAANHAQAMRMYAKAPEHCTYPSTDATFPMHPPEQITYIRDMFDAIWDWTDYGEMAKTLGADNMILWQEAMALEKDDPRRTDLLERIPSRAEQQRKVLGRVLSDYVVEELCWRLLESYASFRCRVAAICESLRSSKQLVKSLLVDTFIKRIANNPGGEFTHKINNMKVNRRKTERLREATSAQKKEE
ncbi:hypothetical protein IF1G_03232 [Cordyceps javanica]|uniref:Uncharacterized protein n=1 Tax=Cordyceps javanica TaxID=43265 RepID=A0A545W5R3_9HYPO|nr:hypothetical protein IF1G_03232 [Cordyceps javanica]TQW09321.1 hypothetical protein IF2G_03752 [Cordyceps javanica]